jgi:hypothetical protein
MRPHWQFVVLGLLTAGIFTALVVMATYLANLLVYRVRLEAAGSHAHGLGANAVYLAGNFPWVALVVCVASLVALVWFIKRFDFSYRAGRWVILGIALLCVAAGTGLAFTSLNSRLETGPLRGFYGQHMKNQNNGNQGRENEPLRQMQNNQQ